MVKSVAIACQGGGSHTAFTAGALKRILRERDKRFEITALSGTSGGSVCALLAWYGLLTKGQDKGKDEAIRLLDSFWNNLSASSFWDRLVNEWGIWAYRQHITISPYSYPPWLDWAQWTKEYLKELLVKHIDFSKIREYLNPASPELIIGAVNVLSGDFKVFKSTDPNFTVNAILASAAEPSFLKAVHIDGNIYWDGLFSQNPPIHDLLEGKDANKKPDEIWVIQIDPQELDYEPTSLSAIEDRRNELAGNLSLNYEMHFIEKINELIEELPRDSKSKRKYKPIKVKRIKVTLEDMDGGNLDVASKWDRNPSFIHKMMSYGEKQAEELFT